jgi:uncharacterized protein YbjT (DUF2867 family)
MTVETLAVFGATGQMGQHVVEYALEIGWNVRALARDATKLKLNTTISPLFQVTFLHGDAIQETVQGATRVICCAGVPHKPRDYEKGFYREICARATTVAGSPTSQTEILSLLSSENLVQSPQFSLS